jgi:hypothetical protein
VRSIAPDLDDVVQEVDGAREQTETDHGQRANDGHYHVIEAGVGAV